MKTFYISPSVHESILYLMDGGWNLDEEVELLGEELAEATKTADGMKVRITPYQAYLLQGYATTVLEQQQEMLDSDYGGGYYEGDHLVRHSIIRSAGALIRRLEGYAEEER